MSAHLTVLEGIHICPGASCVVARAEDDRSTRFCFSCRKHLPHRWELLSDPPERQPSYYESIPVLRCSRCGQDHTHFPGTYPDGPHYPSGAVWEVLAAQAATTRAGWDWDAIWERARAEAEEWAT